MFTEGQSGEEWEPGRALADFLFLRRLTQPPVVTYVLLAVNVLVWMTMTVAGGSTNVEVLVAFGAKVNSLIRAGEWWRLIMPLFLHIGVIHLLFNSYALYVLGSPLENLYGWRPYVLLYFVAGIGGSVGSLLGSENVSAGASGAIFGLLGAGVVFGYRYRKRIPVPFRRYFGASLVPWVAFNLFYGLVNRHLDNYAHLGGLLTGMLLTLLLTPTVFARQPGRWQRVGLNGAVVAVGLLVLLAWGAAVQNIGRSWPHLQLPY
ncbi:MAG TPA: rhomboid family intramembrane serine protease [Armatimonadetes bacterium]|nr:rhomboid family intramembrane serine protease [Armatimonadota bacterium]